MAKSRKEKAPEAGVTVEAEVATTVEATEEAAFDKQNEKALTIMIDNAVKQYSVTDAAIAEMKQRLSGLTVTSVEDKESYELVKAGWQEVKNLRIAVEHKRKALNRNALDYKNAVDAEAKRITALLEEIEEPLKERKDWFDNEKARLKAEAERKKQEEFVARTTFLLQCGFTFNGSMYVLGTLHVTTNQLREYEDAQWAEVASRAKALQMEQLEAQKRAEAEKQAQEAAQKAEMGAMIQERYETRVSWLKSKGWELMQGSWMQSGVRLAADVSVRDFTKEAWQEAVRVALNMLAANATPAPVPTPQATPAPAPVTQAHPAQPEPFWSQPQPVPAQEAAQEQPRVEPTSTGAEAYAEGFRACQALIITKFHDGTPRTRAQWIQLIENLKPV